MKTTPQLLPKVCGADLELANFLEGVTAPLGTGYEASRALLREIDGISDGAQAVTYSSYGGWPYSQGSEALSQDWGRKYTRNGGCCYVDLNHLEVCIPETL